MKLFEYQAKELFAQAGIKIPQRLLVNDADQAQSAAEKVGCPCVIKAQVQRGGRGKAGLIQFADTPDEAVQKARDLIASPHHVTRLLVEEKLEIASEFYAAVTIDPVAGTPLIMVSACGGVDIEEVARSTPEKIIRELVDLHCGPRQYQVRDILFALGLDRDGIKSAGRVLTAMFEIFRARDASLVEINPLVRTAAGEFIAADGKCIIDDGSLFRQPGFERTREFFEDDVEFEAAQEGIPYLALGGDIGLMCAGAGLTNTIVDLLSDFGGKPSNYLEFGGPNYRKAVRAMELTLKSRPRVILVVTFGTIARADVMAEGLAQAIRTLKPGVPVVTAIRGTGEDRAREILRDIGLEPLAETEDAVKRAVELAGKGAA